MTNLNLKLDEQARLKKLVRFQKDGKYVFLGFSLDLNTYEICDLLRKNTDLSVAEENVLTVLLSHYSLAKPSPKAGRLIKYKDLPGGQAYEEAFSLRAIRLIETAFGNNPLKLFEAAEIIGGTPLSFGEAAVEIPAFEEVPIVYILWGAGEFSASATVLFDESASNFLPTEDLAVLGELTTYRLKQSCEHLKENVS